MTQAASKAHFYHQLTTLLSSGLGVQASARHLSSQPNHPRKDLIRCLEQGSNEGLPVHEAFKKYGRPTATAMEISLLQGAERGGKLEIGTHALAKYFDLLAAFWKSVKKAMSYPLLVLHAAIILPSLGTWLSDGDGALSLFVIPLLIAYGIMALLWRLGHWAYQRGTWDETTDLLLSALPFVGAMRRDLSLARFCQVLQIQLNTGGLVSDAIKSAGKAAATARLKIATKSMASEIIQHGKPLGPMLLCSPALPQNLAQPLHTAELVGRLDEQAGQCTEQLMAQATLASEHASKWVPKLLYAIIAFYAIYRILEFYLNYVKLLTGES